MSIQETRRFVTGAVQPNLSKEILNLPMKSAGSSLKFCDYLSQLRQQRFDSDEQSVVSALVTGFLQYWQ